MIFHVTRFGSHHVVTVNAQTPEEAAWTAVRYRGFPKWEGVELRVIQISGEYTSIPYEQTVVVKKEP